MRILLPVVVLGSTLSIIACQSNPPKRQPPTMVMVNGQVQQVELNEAMAPDHQRPDAGHVDKAEAEAGVMYEKLGARELDEYGRDIETGLYPTVVKMYDIRELSRQIPNFQADGAFIIEQEREGGLDVFGESTGTETERLTPRELTDRAMDVVRNLINPEDWRVVGGDQSSMQVMDGLLVVNAPEATHREIETLMNVLNNRAARMIATEIVVAVIPTTTVETWREESLDASLRVSGDALEKVRRQIMTDKSARVISVSRRLSIDGQMTAVNVIKQHAYADKIIMPYTEVDEDNAEKRVVDGALSIRRHFSGIGGSLDPLITSDGKHIRTTIRLQVAAAPTLKELRESIGGLKQVGKLHQPDMQEVEYITFGTTVRLEDGQAVILTQSGSAAERLGATKDHELVLLLRTSIIDSK